MVHMKLAVWGLLSFMLKIQRLLYAQRHMYLFFNVVFSDDLTQDWAFGIDSWFYAKKLLSHLSQQAAPFLKTSEVPLTITHICHMRPKQTTSLGKMEGLSNSSFLPQSTSLLLNSRQAWIHSRLFRVLHITDRTGFVKSKKWPQIK